MPPLLKLYADPHRKESIPFVGFPDASVVMGREGSVEAWLCNESESDYVVEDVAHPDVNVKVELESKKLLPFKPVRVVLTWRPPFSEDTKDWKPLRGGMIIKGYYVVR